MTKLGKCHKNNKEYYREASDILGCLKKYTTVSNYTHIKGMTLKDKTGAVDTVRIFINN